MSETRERETDRHRDVGEDQRLTWVMRSALFAARVVLSCSARVRIEGLDRIAASGPLIVAANHLSNADPPFVGGWLAPALGRRIQFLAKEELFVGPIGRLLRSQGVIPVRRGGSDIEAYRVARRVLDRGGVLCIFPEGTRSKIGQLGEPRAGAALLATRSGAPILPVGVSGTDAFIGPGRRFPKLGARITLRVGAPFRLEPDPALDRRAAAAAASEELMRRIATLVEPRHRGRYEPWVAADPDATPHARRDSVVLAGE